MLETRAAAKKLIEMGEAVGMAVVQFQAYHALAILELGAGRYSEALLAAEFATDRQAIGWRCQSLPLVVEAGLRSGNRKAAERGVGRAEDACDSKRNAVGARTVGTFAGTDG